MCKTDPDEKFIVLLQSTLGKLNCENLGNLAFHLHLAGVIVVISILLIGSGFLYYQNEKAIHKFERFKELHTIGLMKADQLLLWLNERKTEVSFFTSHLPYFQDIINLVSRDIKNEVVFQQLIARIVTDSGYDNIFILDEQLRILYSYDPEFTEMDSLSKQNVSQVFENGELVLQEFYFCRTHDNVHFEIYAPLKDDALNINAVAIFRIDPDDFLYPYFSETTASGKSTESYIVRREGDSVQFLSP